MTTVTVHSLHLYPIKSCAGWNVEQAVLGAAGLEAHGVADRQYLVVDAAGCFVTQRDTPQLARVRPKPDPLRVEFDDLEPLVLPAAGAAGDEVEVQIWRDRVRALDCGEQAARWFSIVCGRPVRLVRHDRVSQRRADPGWTGRDDVPTRFPDGYPYLLIGRETLADFDRRWQRAGHPPLNPARFRPNLVLDGLDAYAEDQLALLDGATIALRPVRPCPRCALPAVDPVTGAVGASPTELLAGYRMDPRTGGATLGQNAIVERGAGGVIRSGSEFAPHWNF